MGRYCRIWLCSLSVQNAERAEPHYYMGLTYNKKDKNEYTNAIEEMELAVEKEPDSQFGKLAKKELDEIKKRKIKMEKFYSN